MNNLKLANSLRPFAALLFDPEAVNLETIELRVTVADVAAAQMVLAAYDTQQAETPVGDHVAEPWSYNRERIGSETHSIALAFGETNARRIVACVNACKGVSTELLEAGSRDDVAGELLALHNFGDKA